MPAHVYDQRKGEIDVLIGASDLSLMPRIKAKSHFIGDELWLLSTSMYPGELLMGEACINISKPALRQLEEGSQSIVSEVSLEQRIGAPGAREHSLGSETTDDFRMDRSCDGLDRKLGLGAEPDSEPRVASVPRVPASRVVRRSSPQRRVRMRSTTPVLSPAEVVKAKREPTCVDVSSESCLSGSSESSDSEDSDSNESSSSDSDGSTSRAIEEYLEAKILQRKAKR